MFFVLFVGFVLTPARACPVGLKKTKNRTRESREVE